MTADITFKVEAIFGSIELVEDRKVESGKLWLGGHSIHRDRRGVIAKITEPEYYGYMTFEEIK